MNLNDSIRSAILIEMPMINTYHTKERLKKIEDVVRGEILKNHHTAKSVGKGIHHNIINGDHVYYKLNGNDVEEMSYINNKRVQVGVTKGNGSSDTIKDMMLHHTKVNGELHSDLSQTKGAKKLWVDLIKSAPPNVKFSSVHDKFGKTTNTELNRDNIDAHVDSIWSDRSTAPYTRLQMTHNGK